MAILKGLYVVNLGLSPLYLGKSVRLFYLCMPDCQASSMLWEHPDVLETKIDILDL